eukprot:4810654-Alexandrium_andersonii.AAC.1
MATCSLSHEKQQMTATREALNLGACTRLPESSCTLCCMPDKVPRHTSPPSLRRAVKTAHHAQHLLYSLHCKL